MARKKEPAAEGDHNLGADDEQVLFISHLSRLRGQMKKVEAAKAVVDAERAVMNDLYHLAKVDKFSRKELSAILADSSASRRDLQAEEERRAQLRAWAGLPVGAQGELFAALPEEVRDDQYYEGGGYAAGLRGDERDAPDGTPPRFIQAWLRGWIAGQEKLAWGLAAAGRIVDRKANANPAPVQLEPEPDEEIDLDAEARRLKATSFMEHSPELTPAA